MRAIVMTNNGITLVDDEDYLFLSLLTVSESYDGYATVHGSDRVRIHRIIMEAPKGSHVDHINGDKLDNRKSNLRICTAQQNGANSRIGKNNTSGYKGVTWNKRRKLWQAQIMVARKNINLGVFSDPKEAHAAYVSAANDNFGEFARAM